MPALTQQIRTRSSVTNAQKQPTYLGGIATLNHLVGLAGPDIKNPYILSVNIAHKTFNNNFHTTSCPSRGKTML